MKSVKYHYFRGPQIKAEEVHIHPEATGPINCR